VGQSKELLWRISIIKYGCYVQRSCTLTVIYREVAAQSTASTITTKYKPNVLDYLNTAANLSNAVNRWFPQDVNLNVRGLVNVVGVGGGGVIAPVVGPYSSGVTGNSDNGQLTDGVFVNGNGQTRGATGSGNLW